MPSGRHRRIAVVALAVLLARATVIGCTGPDSPSAGSPSTTGAAPTLPAGVLAALHTTVAEINAADGSPAAQRAVLEELVAADDAAEQQRCPKATTTVQLEPVWGDVRELPGRPSVYAVPAVVRILSQGRITGTDLTSLVLQVDGPRAATTALCVS